MTGSHPEGITVAIDHGATATAAPVSWAAGRLRDAFALQRVATRVVHDRDPSGPAVVVSLGERSALTRRITRTGIVLPQGEESFVVSTDRDDDLTLVWGSDTRGLVYGILELADRVDHSTLGSPARGDRPPFEGAR